VSDCLIDFLTERYHAVFFKQYPLSFKQALIAGKSMFQWLL